MFMPALFGLERKYADVASGTRQYLHVDIYLLVSGEHAGNAPDPFELWQVGETHFRLQKLEKEEKRQKAKQLQLRIALSFQSKRRQDPSDTDDNAVSSSSSMNRSMGKMNGAKTSTLDLRLKLAHARTRTRTRTRTCTLVQHTCACHRIHMHMLPWYEHAIIVCRWADILPASTRLKVATEGQEAEELR